MTRLAFVGGSEIKCSLQNGTRNRSCRSLNGIDNDKEPRARSSGPRIIGSWSSQMCHYARFGHRELSSPMSNPWGEEHWIAGGSDERAGKQGAARPNMRPVTTPLSQSCYKNRCASGNHSEGIRRYQPRK